MRISFNLSSNICRLSFLQKKSQSRPSFPKSELLWPKESHQSWYSEAQETISRLLTVWSPWTVSGLKMLLPGQSRSLRIIMPSCKPLHLSIREKKGYQPPSFLSQVFQDPSSHVLQVFQLAKFLSNHHGHAKWCTDHLANGHLQSLQCKYIAHSAVKLKTVTFNCGFSKTLDGLFSCWMSWSSSSHPFCTCKGTIKSGMWLNSSWQLFIALV